jgi:hypothetical protein
MLEATLTRFNLKLELDNKLSLKVSRLTRWLGLIIIPNNYLQSRYFLLY